MALIVDTGPLFALLDRRDAEHQRSRELIETAKEPVVIPAPVLVEVDYWINKWLRPSIRVVLLDDIQSEAYRVENVLPGDYQRIRELCDRYWDADVGFVDASVLAIVERLNEPKLATLDHRHFGMMRPNHVSALRLLPD